MSEPYGDKYTHDFFDGTSMADGNGAIDIFTNALPREEATLIVNNDTTSGDLDEGDDPGCGFRAPLLQEADPLTVLRFLNSKKNADRRDFVQSFIHEGIAPDEIAKLTHHGETAPSSNPALTRYRGAKHSMGS